MKKYLNIALVLAAIGLMVSCLLLIQHYNLNSGLTSFFCGEGSDNHCRVLSLSAYSTLFNIPVAAYGIFFFSFIIISLLISDIAGGDYYSIFLAVLLPVSAVSFVISIVLFIIILVLQIFCQLCIATHVANALLFITLIFYYINLKAKKNIKYTELIKKILRLGNTSHDARAAFASFIILQVLLMLSIFLTVGFFESKASGFRNTDNRIYEYLQDYYSTKPEIINLEPSKLITGNPDAELTITVFTDFLCFYCYKFHTVEEYLLSRFNNKIKFAYYNYPLDTNCNKSIKRTVYGNSCLASRAMFAASELGIFVPYMRKHFSLYKKIKSGYSQDIAVDVLVKAGYGSEKDKFIRLLNSGDVSNELIRDIGLSGINKVRATPTIFIANRRISGTRPEEVLEKIIIDEFKKKDK